MNGSDLLSLTEIGKRNASDKFTVHDFGAVYERYFDPLRFEPIKILEIGIGGEALELGGASLLTWKEYFPNAHIFGIDLYDKAELASDRIMTFACDQADQDRLRQISSEYGPFDIIIDDGSHMSLPTLRSFFVLFHAMKPGGYYAIEDIQTSYWPHYGGSSIAGDAVETAVFWIRHMIDCINQDEILWPDHPAKKSGFVVSELHVHHNIALIRRGEHPETSAVLTPQMRKDWLAADFETQKITEQIAQKAAYSPDFRRKLLQFLSNSGL
jgi:8-demethyl-8-alpha-L-rhamnosyltetracenomycin-C 2'-O-methyltransferase